MSRTAVILNITQARIFAERGQMVEQVVSFCPNVTYFLKERGYNVTSTAEIYKAYSHARVVAVATREMHLITDAAARQYGLDELNAVALRTHLHNCLCCIYHLHFSLRGLQISGKVFYWVAGKRVQHGDYAAMFTTLAKQMSPSILGYARVNYSLPHYLLAALYNAILFLFARKCARLKVMDYGDELPKRITRAMIANGENLLVFQTHTIGKNAYKTTHFFVKSLARFFARKSQGKPLYIFRIAPPYQYRARIAAFNTPKLTSPLVQKLMPELIAQSVPFLRTEVQMGKDIVRKVKPDMAISEHANYAHVLAGLSQLHAQGGKHAMINHGTHTLQHGAMSQAATLSWGAQQHLITPYTTHALPKSPLAAALYPLIRKDSNYKMCRINVYGTVANETKTDGKFILLHAGNYTDPYHHVPWCKETADEYLLAIVEMLEEVAKLDNVELIIKLKNKKSATHKAIVESHIARLGITDKARVDTTGKFSELMARAHLMVCNLSGTIEEALANHIPVMLHTYRKHYFHIDEETVAASTMNGLSPCYLVKQRADIGHIITSLSVRRGELRDAALYTKVAWQQKQLTSINDFAKDLAEDARKTKGIYAH